MVKHLEHILTWWSAKGIKSDATSMTLAGFLAKNAASSPGIPNHLSESAENPLLCLTNSTGNLV
jgi:hypothetical protein